MVSVLATITWYLFLVVALWGFQRLTRCFTQLNIFTICIGFLLLRHGVTVPFDDAVNQWYANIYLSGHTLRRFYTALVIMWLCLLAGVWVGRRCFGSGVLNPKAFHKEVTSGPLPTGMNVPLFLAFVAGGVGLITFYQLLSSQVSFVQLLSGQLTSTDYREMRDTFGEATHYTVSVGQRLASIVRFGLLPFFIATLYFLSRRGLVWRAMFLFVLGLGLAVGLLSGQKTAAVILIADVALAVYLRRGQLRVGTWNKPAWGFAVFVWFVASPYLYHLQYPDQDYSWLLRATSHRMTSEYDRSLQLYFEIYPDVQPHLYGRSSSLINAVLGVSIPYDLLPERFIPTYYLGSGYLNTWSACFVGVAWADFGYAGVVAESIAVGFLLQAYAAWFRRARKTALVMGTQVGLMIATTRLSEVALTASLLSFGLLSGFLVSWLVGVPTLQTVRQRERLAVLAEQHVRGVHSGA